MIVACFSAGSHSPLAKRNGSQWCKRSGGSKITHVVRCLALAAFTSIVLGFNAQAATPAIIPQPVILTVRSNVFTLIANQSNRVAIAVASTKILVDNSSLATGQFLAMTLSRSTGCQFPVSINNNNGPIRNAILFTTNNALTTLGTEGYELTVAADSVVVRAPTQAGLFYGMQSLLQLFPAQIMSPQVVTNVAWTAQCVYIQDQPRFAYRGVMLDVARHFVDKQEVEKILDGLALHKINQFHWHLCDDHGWRLEIKAYPTLTLATSTNTGAWRSTIDYGNNPLASTAWNSFGKYGGYYSQDDVREVVAYATQRHINVIPELEFPAHCTAALLSCPQFGCGNTDDTTHYNVDNIHYSYTLFSLANAWPTFFTNVLTEVCNIFPSQYIHCGGDEVTSTGDTQWASYTPDVNLMSSLGITVSGNNTSLRQYQFYLSTNLVSFLQSKGRTMGGWSEIEDYQTVTNALLYEWETDKASTAAAAGQPVVMCPNGINYYEIPSTSTSPYATNVEPMFSVGGNPSYKTLNNLYTYNPITSSGASGSATNNIIGVQVNLWTENVPSPLNVEYKIFPRICAEAELGWTPLSRTNYTDFTNRLVTADQRLAQMGINYNKENVPLIGTWTSAATTGTTNTFDISTNVTKTGEIDIAFVFTSGANAVDVSNAILFENGVQIDTDSHSGRAGAMFPTSVTYFAQASTYTLAYYVFHLKTYHPGATYTVQATLTGAGGSASNGNVYMPNWN